MKKSISFFPAPILNLRGIVIISFGIIFPIFGLLGAINSASVTTLLVFYAILISAVIIYDYARTKDLVNKIDFNWEAAELIYSGVETELEIDLKLDAKTFGPFKLKLRPESLLNLKVKNEIYSLDFKTNQNSSHIKHRITPTKRGKLSLNKIYIRATRNPYLWSWQAEVEMPELSVTVLPNANIHALKSTKSFQKLQIGNSISEQFKSEGREFDSLRKYTIGDDLRKVDWKRSARGRGLFVKNYRPETHQRVSIAIDCSRRMSNRIGDRMQIEYATDAAAHLLQLAKAQEDEVGFFAFNHKVLTSISCKKGKKQEKLIIDALQTLSASTLEPDYQLLTEWGHTQRKRSLLVLITSITNPISLEGIRNALKPLSSKHLVLVIAIADRDLQELTQVRANSLDDAYIISAAVEQIEQIDKRKRQLKAAGIECIYCDAALVSSMLHQKYYELKVRGRL